MSSVCLFASANVSNIFQEIRSYYLNANIKKETFTKNAKFYMEDDLSVFQILLGSLKQNIFKH